MPCRNLILNTQSSTRYLVLCQLAGVRLFYDHFGVGTWVFRTIRTRCNGRNTPPPQVWLSRLFINFRLVVVFCFFQSYSSYNNRRKILFYVTKTKFISIFFFFAAESPPFQPVQQRRRLSEIAIKVLDEKIAESNRVVTPYFLIEMQTLT